MNPTNRDGHTLALTIHSESIVGHWVCPHEGKTFESPKDAPNCRVVYDDGGDETVSRRCWPGEHYGELGFECLTVDSPNADRARPGSPFRLESLPLHVAWWLDGDEFYCAPYAPEVTNDAQAERVTA